MEERMESEIKKKVMKNNLDPKQKQVTSGGVEYDGELRVFSASDAKASGTSSSAALYIHTTSHVIM